MTDIREKIERYDLGFVHDEMGMTMTFRCCNTGEYVAFEDLEKLLERNELLEAVYEAAQRTSFAYGHHEIGVCMCPLCDLHIALAAVEER